MTITNGYTTLALFKARKDISSTNAADDAVIETLIEQASRLIDNETGRHFYTSTNDETRVYTATNGYRVYTDDIITITSVKLDFDGDRTYETTMAATDYDTYPINAALRGEPITWLQRTPIGVYPFPTHARGVQIIGKFGFCALANVPVDIIGACEEIVTGAYGRRTGENTTGIATVTAAGVVLTPKDIPDTAWRVIKYRTRL